MEFGPPVCTRTADADTTNRATITTNSTSSFSSKLGAYSHTPTAARATEFPGRPHH